MIKKPPLGISLARTFGGDICETRVKQAADAMVSLGLRDAGYELGNCDCTICAEAPKLNPHIPAMTACLAEVMGVSEGQISIKATTTEKLGFVGRKEGIAAQAVVLIEKTR